MKLKYFVALSIYLMITSGCASLNPKPFKLDINVNFTTDEARVSVVDSEGQMLAFQTFKRDGETWQKLQDPCSLCLPAAHSAKHLFSLAGKE